MKPETKIVRAERGVECTGCRAAAAVLTITHNWTDIVHHRCVRCADQSSMSLLLPPHAHQVTVTT